MHKSEQEILDILLRRVERLKEEYAVNAPAVIKTTEIRLVLEAVTELQS